MNKLKEELSRLDLTKQPTKYLISLLRRVQKEKSFQWDYMWDYYIDENLYGFFGNCEIKIKNILNKREHIETSKIERKKIRQLAAKRGR